MRVIYTAPATFGLIALALGATPLWRKIWVRFPQLNTLVFPDLNGRWETEIHSNIAAMAAHLPDIASTDPNTIKTLVPAEFELVRAGSGSSSASILMTATRPQTHLLSSRGKIVRQVGSR